HQQGDSKNHKQMRGLEKTFKHDNLLAPLIILIPTLPEAGAFVNFRSGSNSYVIDRLRFYTICEQPPPMRLARLNVSWKPPPRSLQVRPLGECWSASPCDCSPAEAGDIILKTLSSHKVDTDPEGEHNMAWTTPIFEEVSLCCEINSYASATH